MGDRKHVLKCKMTKSEQGRFKINEILNYKVKWAWEECIVINILKGIIYVEKWHLPPTEEINIEEGWKNGETFQWCSEN